MKARIQNFINRHDIKISFELSRYSMPSIGVKFTRWVNWSNCDGHPYSFSVFLWNYIFSISFNTFR